VYDIIIFYHATFSFSKEMALEMEFPSGNSVSATKPMAPRLA